MSKQKGRGPFKVMTPSVGLENFSFKLTLFFLIIPHLFKVLIIDLRHELRCDDVVCN
jgi:hypothetical protein